MNCGALPGFVGLATRKGRCEGIIMFERRLDCAFCVRMASLSMHERQNMFFRMDMYDVQGEHQRMNKSDISSSCLVLSCQSKRTPMVNTTTKDNYQACLKLDEIMTFKIDENRKRQ